jgi:hypothetical protein
MRAGLVRQTTIETFVVGTLDDFQGVTVHAAPLIAHGFEGDARLLRLLQAAFGGLRSGIGSPWRGARSAFYVSLPNPDRQHTGFELIADEALRREEIERWEEIQANRLQPVDWNRRAKELLTRAATLAGWEDAVDLRAYSMGGNTGVAEMMEAAARDLTAGTIDLALVGGVDSFIDTASLRWLEQRGRLKSPATPAGLMPGEASGFLLMEASHRAQSREAEILAVLVSTIFGREANPRLSGGVSLGEALATMLAQTTPLAPWSADSPPWLICDQNGESYCAHEWGCALTRLVGEHPEFQNPTVWYPVVSVGETGAASGIIQTNMALQAFRRRYAPGSHVALLASADDGPRSVALVGAAA